MQKFPSPSFTVTTKLNFHGDMVNDRCGLVVMGKEWEYLALVKTEQGAEIGLFKGKYQQCVDLTVKEDSIKLQGEVSCYFRIHIDKNGFCHFNYSTDNKDYIHLGNEFKAQQGVWIGAKVGIFRINPNIPESRGYADFDWFRIE